MPSIKVLRWRSEVEPNMKPLFVVPDKYELHYALSFTEDEFEALKTPCFMHYLKTARDLALAGF